MYQNTYKDTCIAFYLNLSLSISLSLSLFLSVSLLSFSLESKFDHSLLMDMEEESILIWSL